MLLLEFTNKNDSRKKISPCMNGIYIFASSTASFFVLTLSGKPPPRSLVSFMIHAGRVATLFICDIWRNLFLSLCWCRCETFGGLHTQVLNEVLLLLMMMLMHIHVFDFVPTLLVSRVMMSGCCRCSLPPFHRCSFVWISFRSCSLSRSKTSRSGPGWPWFSL